MQNNQNLISINQTTGPDSIMQKVPLAQWLRDPDVWDKSAFIQEASQYLWDAYGNTTEQDKHALAMLAEVLETFVTCCKDITKNGLVVIHHNGVTGKNHHVDIRDKSITKAVLLMNELGLTPKSRLSLKSKRDQESGKFIIGPLEWAEESADNF